MKILCETNIINRNNHTTSGKFKKSTLAIGRKDSKSNLFIILINANNNTKYGKF